MEQGKYYLPSCENAWGNIIDFALRLGTGLNIASPASMYPQFIPITEDKWEEWAQEAWRTQSNIKSPPTGVLSRATDVELVRSNKYLALRWTWQHLYAASCSQLGFHAKYQGQCVQW